MDGAPYFKLFEGHVPENVMDVGALYKLVNECDPQDVPMGALYGELSAMLEHGVTEERVSAILAQIDTRKKDTTFKLKARRQCLPEWQIWAAIK